MVGAAEQPRVVRVRHLVVADHVLAVHRHTPSRADGCDQLRALVVHRGRVPGRLHVGEALVLDPDRTRVVVPVARVPRDVLLGHHLRDVPVVGDHVVRRGRRGRILEMLDRRAGRALDVVDDDHLHRVVVRAVGHAVVGRVRRIPCRARIVGNGRHHSRTAAWSRCSGRARDTLRRQDDRLASSRATGHAAAQHCIDLLRNGRPLGRHDRGLP